MQTHESTSLMSVTSLIGIDKNKNKGDLLVDRSGFFECTDH